MKIFLSYGHDNTSDKLVKRIKSDLSVLGHEVWIDRDRIGFGDDWRREITNGIVESDQVLAFLSQHSTRDPGVCRNEIAIALGAGNAYVFTILVQAEQEIDLPLSVSHLQWLDMHDWQTRQQDPKQFEVWYAECLAKIVAVIEHPDNQRFAGEISQLEQYLKPLDCTADIYSRVDGFIGRDWLFDAIEAWRLGDRSSKVFWISGGPGVGKSAVAAWLAHSGKSHVIAAQFCRFNSPERREPTRVIRSIAFQLATRLPDYRRHLIHKPEIADLDRKNPSDLFDYLIADPLRYAIDGQRPRHLIVLDALDETLTEGNSELTDLIASQVHKLPDWIAWVVTSRPEPAIRGQLKQFGIHEINTDDPRNAADIARYIQQWLTQQQLPPSCFKQASERISQATQGNFLYLRELQRAVDRHVIDLNHPDDLPQGLSALFAREFRHRFSNVQAYENDILPLLEILVASSRPIPETEIETLLNCGKRQRLRMLAQLGSYVTETIEGIALFHKSLKDWLVDEKSAGADYFVEVASGHQMLGNVLWQQFTDNPDLITTLDSYMALELPHQLSHWSDANLLKLVGNDAAQKFGDYIQEFVEFKALPFDKHVQQKEWGYFWLRMGELGLGMTHQFLSDITNVLGLMLRYQGDYAGAEPLLRRALGIAEQTLGPDHPTTGDRLNNLGLLLKDQGDYGAAEPLLRRALAIAEQALGPGHPDTGAYLNNLGLLLHDQGDYVGAELLYRRALAITEKALGPDHPDTRTYLSNLGRLLQAQGDYAGAEPLYRRALGIAEQALGPDHPDTGIRLSNLGALLLLKDQEGDYARAELLLRRALGITEQALGSNHPDTGTRLNYLRLLLKYMTSDGK